MVTNVKKTKSIILGVLSAVLLLSLSLAVAFGFGRAFAAARVKPTGTNATTLTAPLDDSDLSSFRVYGSSIRTAEPAGMRFLVTIDGTDLAKIPNDADFGLLIIPANILGGETLTVDTEKVLKAKAVVDTDAEEVPDGGMGYMMTLVGETLEKAFPEGLFNRVLATRAFVRYTYEDNGNKVTAYAYSQDTLYRSIAYVASRELAEMERRGEDVSDSTSFMNRIISTTIGSASFTLSSSEIEVGERAVAVVHNATDGINAFDYYLRSSDESVAEISGGNVVGVSRGTATITVAIGTTELSLDITVNGPEAFTGGNILYSTLSKEVFIPDGLLDSTGERIISAVGETDKADYLDAGTWSGLELTAEEINSNATKTTRLVVSTSDGDSYIVNAISYAGVINELSDFTTFFDVADTAVYGQYVVINDIGDGTQSLTNSNQTQTLSDNGFYGVLDGQGHTLNFKLMKGGLLGLIMGNATVKNLAIYFEDNSYVSMGNGGFGIFGYGAQGNVLIDNCYIERTNNVGMRGTSYGIMACPFGRVTLKNTLVCGQNTTLDDTWYDAANVCISSSSTNAYVVSARTNLTVSDWAMSVNYTKIYQGWDQRYVVLSEIADASGFNSYWSRANSRLSWQGATSTTSYDVEKTAIRVDDEILYSTVDSQIFLPSSFGFGLDETVVITADDGKVYYQDGYFSDDLALTTAQIKANAIATFKVRVIKDDVTYITTVKSYAGVIDELSDFVAFFDKAPETSYRNTSKNSDGTLKYPDGILSTPNVYGYYIVTKDLGDGTDELSFDNQTTDTDYVRPNGFNGVLDGQGYTLNFKLMKGGLLGLIMGNATVKNVSIVYEDDSFVSSGNSGGYGVFGYMAQGNMVIDNCYIERTNNLGMRGTSYGIMARPYGRVTLTNTLVCGQNTTLDDTWYDAAQVCISESSTNAFVVSARTNLAVSDWNMSANYTKLYQGWDQRYALLSDIEDASGFSDNYWTKEGGKLTWKGATSTTSYVVSGVDPVVYVDENVLYSTNNSELLIPDELGFDLDSSVVITSKDGETTYYTGGAWVNSFALTSSQITANEIASFDVLIEKDGAKYLATVKSYAGVIDELSDFATFFDNDTSTTAPNTYGYYIVVGDLGTPTSELTLTQTETTTYSQPNGFCGVLDGQGHTLQFKLKSGGLVGMILGHATIKNLGVIYEDATTTQYGVFGKIAMGAPVIDNCYVERTNLTTAPRSTFGLMDDPLQRLVLRNTVVYGYYFDNNNTYQGGGDRCRISASSENAYVIHAREAASGWNMSVNFTKVFNDGISNGSREVLLSEISDASGFNNAYWYKENGKLIWKGLEIVTATWIKGEEVIEETVTRGSKVTAQELPEDVVTDTEETTYYWSATDGGDEFVFNADLVYTPDLTFYMVSVSTLVGDILYSTSDSELFFPEVLDFDLDKTVSIVSADGETTYYERGFWINSFAVTSSQILANEVASFDVKIIKGAKAYNATVKSYAGVIDELSDFVTFFDKAPETSYRNTKDYPDGILAAQNVYGYYVVIADLGDGTDELDFANQTINTDYVRPNGFSGVLDGQGHTLKFKLMHGGLVGLVLGNATIKNVAVIYEDNSFEDITPRDNANGFGVFGYITQGTPVIDNCYIERTNNVPSRSSVFGLMARPNSNLVLRNTVVYGYNVPNDATWWSSVISPSSTNAYVVNGRSNAATQTQATNFTKVYTDGTGGKDDERAVMLEDIDDASGFNDDYWTKDEEAGVLTWNGATGVSMRNMGAIAFDDRYLAQNNATEYKVIIPDGADDRLVYAKDELINFFEEATGATLELADDRDYDTLTDGKYISIGDTQIFEASGVSLTNLNSQGYRLKTIGDTIYINGDTSLGALYGVYGLLRELFNFEQYSYDCYALDSVPSPRFPSLNVTENPDFEIRLPVNGGVMLNEDYANRTLMTSTSYIFPAGDHVNNGGAGWRDLHNSFLIIPPSYWSASHRYWFSDDGEQLCYTAHGDSSEYNALVSQIVDVMKLSLGSDTLISRYPDALYITLTTQDGDGHCTCSACKAAKAKYGSDVGAVIALCNDVRAGIEDWMNENPKYKRDLTLLFFAYNAYVDAPATYNSATGKYEFNGGLTMRSDVGVFYAVSDYVNYYYDIYNSENDTFRAQFNAWADLTEASGSQLCLWTYSQNFAHYMLRADVYGSNAFFNGNAYRYFADRNVKLFFNQGPSNSTATVSSFAKLNAFIDSQMMWDSTQNVETLIAEWFNAMYGAGASYMKSLYTAENYAAHQVYNTTKKGIPTVSIDANKARTYFKSNINTWFGYITSAKNAINDDASLTSDQKAAIIDRINEEWIAVKFWQVYLYKGVGWRYGINVNTATARNEFRQVLGYNSSTGTYAKDVRILENKGYMTLVEWIESGFSSSLEK